MKKRKIKICFLSTGILLIIILITITGYIIYQSHFHIDFSQSYRNIEGYENIIFRDAYLNQDYKRSIWGLRKVDTNDSFIEQYEYDIDKDSDEYKLLANKTDTRQITQIVLSPNGRYILYVESLYRGSGITDDEDVFFRVYDIHNDTITTIYQGYRKFLLVDWK